MEGELDFEQFFQEATGYRPYPYQAKLALSSNLPSFLDIPTGLGKTAAVTTAWLWRRFFGESVREKSPEKVRSETPRRLVYCLPMRVLVEQTAASARNWIEKLSRAGLIPFEKKPDVFLLMGGEIDRDWDVWPERESILIGTQDQLISRALNRGYAMSRFRWPVHFAFLNNDALWVMDEVQLMGPGLPSTVQLEGFRKKMEAYGSPSSIWTSATLRQGDFLTIDSPFENQNWEDLRLGLGEDVKHSAVKKRIAAKKTLKKCETVFRKKTVKDYAANLASEIKSKYEVYRGLTIVIQNQVRRAQAVTSALRELFRGMERPPKISLVHSRFRAQERRYINQLISELSSNRVTNHIIVATQAIEAGVDISASTLITELAPWSSLVQRFGRLNRYGEEKDAQAFWIDINWQWEEKGKLKTEPSVVLPYEGPQLDLSRERLLKLVDVGPSSLKALDLPPTGATHHIIRKKDILELFDTTPDLAGNDIDVSVYIRDATNLDISVFWRKWEGNNPPRNMPAPSPDELCPVPVGEMRDFLGDREAWIWDSLESSWRK